MNVQELIFHAGIPKTGTTAIQDFLYCNKDKLLRDYGILYPNTYGYNNHFIYAVAISKPNYYSPNPLEKLGIGFEELAFKLKEEIQELKPDKVLLSSEDFMWHIHGLSKIVEVIKPIIVKVVVYLRRQDNAINSGYNELVKSDGIPVFLKSFLYTLYISLNYYEFLKNIKNSLRFDDSISISIIPRIYYRDFDKSWDAVEDFCDVLSIPKSVFTEHKNEINVSLSPTSTEALKRIKEKYLLPPGIFKKVVSFLYEYERENPSKIKTLMPLEERKKILGHYRESNEKLFREYFDRENQFVLSKEEEELYREQEKMQKKEIEAEIEKKYKAIIDFIVKNSLVNSLTPRVTIYTHQKYGMSELTREFIKHGLITDWIGGHVDVCNEEGIAGWLLDLEDKDAYFMVKLNGTPVYIGKPNLERKDVKENFGVDVNAGFKISWKDAKLPEDILNLPDDTELEVEVIHERTGYIIPGNYKRLSKRALLEKIIPQKDELKITKILTTLKQNFFYCFFNNLDKVKEIKPLTTNVSVLIQQNGKDWNVLCIAPKEQDKIVLEVFYNDGRKEEVSLTV